MCDSDLVARTGRHQQRYEDGCRLIAGSLSPPLSIKFNLRYFVNLSRFYCFLLCRCCMCRPKWLVLLFDFGCLIDLFISWRVAGNDKNNTYVQNFSMIARLLFCYLLIIISY
jgi:hypothetical protein